MSILPSSATSQRVTSRNETAILTNYLPTSNLVFIAVGSHVVTLEGFLEAA